MESKVSFNQLKQFPRLMWIVLFGDLITRGSFYMVWPFLAVMLYKSFGISATQVGLILSGAAVISVFIGFFGGALSDKFGRKIIMFSAGSLYVISFVLLANVETVTGYVIVIALCSISKAIWDPPTQALVSDILPDVQVRELGLQARYFVINVGCAIGPMAGVYIGITGQQSGFLVTAGAFALWMLLLAYGMRHFTRYQANQKANQQANLQARQSEIVAKDEREVQQESNQQPQNAKSKATQKASYKPKSNMLDTLKILAKDRVLQCLIVANIICKFVYAQMDSTLIQYLTRADVPELMKLISSMIFANAAVIVCLQFVLLKMMARLSLTSRIQVGLVLLALAQVWMAINPVTAFWGWIGAVVILSIGEAILFPTMNVHIDRLAPTHLRGAYFGAASFYYIGFALAPLGGGAMLDFLGGAWVFVIAALLVLLVMYLYSILDTLTRPNFAKAEKASSRARR
ncbi:MDR family MFS transporter [Thalassotalea euphylliae]|uniref:MFS transporter n=1 Tax=Thalassotalea euphylliae TaxID=1655234 RepID=A0A3E0UH26_9GAMM|nr:MFS transporter [Thalassotalea euphylliae]REL36308.1 MFS transporter [Thalassotalea euphylliae]